MTRPDLRIVSPWPEAPAPDYVRPMTPHRMAQATADFDMIEALRDEHWRQEILMRQRRDERYRARFWLVILVTVPILLGCLVAWIAHMETAVHVSGGVNG